MTSNALKSNRFDLTVKGDLSDKRTIIAKIDEQLVKMGYTIEQTRRHPMIYTLGFVSLGDCPKTTGMVSKTTQFNDE